MLTYSGHRELIEELSWELNDIERHISKCFYSVLVSNFFQNLRYLRISDRRRMRKRNSSAYAVFKVTWTYMNMNVLTFMFINIDFVTCLWIHSHTTGVWSVLLCPLLLVKFLFTLCNLEFTERLCFSCVIHWISVSDGILGTFSAGCVLLCPLSGCNWLL